MVGREYNCDRQSLGCNILINFDFRVEKRGIRGKCGVVKGKDGFKRNEVKGVG